MADEKEFESLYEKYAPALYRAAYRMVENNSDALDIVQEAFLRAMNGFSGFRNESRIQTWLYRIVMNLCYDHFRKRKKITYLPEEAIVMPQRHDNYEAQEIKEARRERLKLALEKITLRQKAVFTLRIYKELSYDEIARALNVKTGTVKATFFQTVEKLKILMREGEKNEL